MTDYALGRVPSLNPVRLVRYALTPIGPPRSYTWACGVNLDQGSIGACVGFSWAAEASAKPKPVPHIDNPQGLQIYHLAQTLDEYPGENYEGTSVDGGAKAARQTGWIGPYRWATNAYDAASALSRYGPGIFGINWYNSMFTPVDGYLSVSGPIAGGHAILARGFSVRRDAFLLHNSWGAGWGGTDKGPGTAWLRYADAVRLLGEQGEFCIPLMRYW